MDLILLRKGDNTINAVERIDQNLDKLMKKLARRVEALVIGHSQSHGINGCYRAVRDFKKLWDDFSPTLTDSKKTLLEDQWRIVVADPYGAEQEASLIKEISRDLKVLNI
jgi:hypothetical protein